MLDYQAAYCFYQVAKLQSFEAAAQALSLTQSAVSQKVKRLEHSFGAPLLIRERPIRLTSLGEHLVTHIQKVLLLEDGLLELFHGSGSEEPLSIAVNNDVLATWFVDVLSQFSDVDSTILQVKSQDQSKTRELLQRGDVMACVCDVGAPVSGGRSVSLGNMTYELVATPEFVNKHFPNGIDETAVTKLPSLIYDEHDIALWRRYQQECLWIEADTRKSHWYPSSHGFVALVKSGTVCALIPSVQIKEELSSGQLISLFPNQRLEVPLFWHWYELGNPVLERLTKVVQSVTRTVLL
ncbi:ArgP/LysG family DNA-binding transcriptional regulator [Marinomonas gallaica]|uniref:ArgP/LysG family DNA-binding transcriptional regulator n=1 Tax=Marinomonas gallaica TaxID=1806667 RepID=UPI003A8CD194